MYEYKVTEDVSHSSGGNKIEAIQKGVDRVAEDGWRLVAIAAMGEKRIFMYWEREKK